MTNKKRILLIAIITILFLVINTISIQAGGNAEKKLNVEMSERDRKEFEQVFQRTNNTFGHDVQENAIYAVTKTTKQMYKDRIQEDVKILEYDGTTLTVFTKNLHEASNKEVREVMTEFLNNIERSSMTRDSKTSIRKKLSDAAPIIRESNNVVDMGRASDINLPGAYVIFSNATSVIRVILGLISIVTMFLMAISTVLDLMFLGLPVFRNAAKGFSEGRGTKKPLFISDDAMKVIEETETDVVQGNKNPYYLYFKKRFLTYIVFFGCLAYLVLGGSAGFIQGIMNIVNNIIN